VLDRWAERRLDDEPTPSEIRQLMAHVKTHVVARRNARGGRSAEEHLVAALRCLYQRAVDDGLINGADNPARKVAKPRRLSTTRRALPDTRLAQINEVAATTGDDPELDTLILRLHTETACRRGGALALRPRDLDQDQCLVLLREKGETVRWQPVSPTLMGRLVEHARERHAPPGGQLLRYANGRPITSRRYDHLWTRLGRQLPWVRTQQISSHWIRHTTLTWVSGTSATRSPALTPATPTAAASPARRRPTCAPASPRWPPPWPRCPASRIRSPRVKGGDRHGRYPYSRVPRHGLEPS
jgi:integrase/recombinase XerC